MRSRALAGAITFAVVFASCSSSDAESTTTTRGIPEPWPATCDHVSAIEDAWQPLIDDMDERDVDRIGGATLGTDLRDESDRLIETMVLASVEGAALASEGDTWAEVLRLYADDVLSWFPDLLGDPRNALVRGDEVPFGYDSARYGVLDDRCTSLTEQSSETDDA